MCSTGFGLVFGVATSLGASQIYYCSVFDREINGVGIWKARRRNHTRKAAGLCFRAQITTRQKMRRSSSLLPVCTLVLAMLCVASLMGVTEGRRGGGRTYIGGGGGARGSATRTSGSPRGLSGGTWAACAGSSLLAAAAMLL
uniref:Uncharacterized protein n=1 Tax=Oryza nivara TaxID=4536 RepID=A0A0E0FUD7_ORYNI